MNTTDDTNVLAGILPAPGGSREAVVERVLSPRSAQVAKAVESILVQHEDTGSQMPPTIVCLVGYVKQFYICYDNYLNYQLNSFYT